MEEHGQTRTEGIWFAYLAGYIDGDGCFRYGHSPEISITNTFPYTLYRIRDEFGGTCRKQQRNDRSRSIFQWRLYGSPAIELIKKLRPYLWEKLPQADLVLAIRAETTGPKRDGLIRQLSDMKTIDYGR